MLRHLEGAASFGVGVGEIYLDGTSEFLTQVVEALGAAGW